MRRSRHNSALQVQDDWPIKKALTLSDVDITHPFLTLPRQPVETYILVHLTQLECDHLMNREQVPINAQDDDTGDAYIMKLKWRGSYYNLIGKWGRIVRSKGLDVGKVIKIRWFNGCLHFSVPDQVISAPPLQVIPAFVSHDQWPIRKVLTLSDVDTNHPFLPLARRSVEDHILVHWTPQQRELLRNEEQVNLNARDVDTGEIYVMKLRWRGNYYNLIGKWGKIIRSKGLGVGKEIKIRWANGCLHFSVPYEQTVVPATIPLIQQQPHQEHHQQQQPHQEHHQQQHHHQQHHQQQHHEQHHHQQQHHQQHHQHHHQQHQQHHQQQQHRQQQQQHDEWPIKKALTLSDVDTNHPFLTLPGKSVEDHILLYWASQAREQLRNDYQINVNARDYDTGDSFLMKLKCRGSYYNLIGKWGQIIRSKGLQVGQEIRVYDAGTVHVSDQIATELLNMEKKPIDGLEGRGFLFKWVVLFGVRGKLDVQNICFFKAVTLYGPSIDPMVIIYDVNSINFRTKGNCDLGLGMENSKGKHYLLPPKSPFPSIAPFYSEYAPNTSNGSKRTIPKHRDVNSLHQRTSSEIIVMEEQSSWLDELLDEPETPVKRGHRRSSSDSFTYIEAANANTEHAAQVKYRLRNMNSVTSWASQEFDVYKQKPVIKNEIRVWVSPQNASNCSSSQEVNRTKSTTTTEKQEAVDSCTQDAHASSDTDIKRSKQQFAQRSRVRKLQYIAELERNVQALQAEGCEVSGELKFLNDRSLILTMENKALKQRLENLAQEQLIKYLEHELLEREIGRLRALYKQQKLPPKDQPLVSRGRTNGRDNMESQFANLSLKNKEPGAMRDAVSGSIRI
ncbi:hypothetical protein L1987_32056 [Smallanthus sonchifolius]|uniref:Uncharacterized protein n=1 Tax=Smallanthus sonchifolius TaxID=185202 RepID=A0ACB9IA13_9ASTR|nr:hypothetical protein L1987_32056 [Smallanthus sonchifolius]